MLVGFFMIIIVERYLISNDAFSNMQIIYEYTKDRDIQELVQQEYRKDLADKYIQRVISKMFTGNEKVIETVNSYNKKHNITKGVVYTAFNVFTKTQVQLQNIVNSIQSFENGEILASTFLLISSLSGLLIRIFIAYPIRISESRIYLESINYKKTNLRRLSYSFKKGRYLGAVKSILLMEIRKFLWNLTIIGGFIKNYSYKMVTYIIAENPKISAKDAIKMSREMMNGNKLNSFKLDLTFLGWNILQYITFGIAGIYVGPYYTMTYTQLYKELREEYIKNKKFNFELLNDNNLFEENELDIYPDVHELNKKKLRINYNKKYELSSIVLFFFIFSFVGWLWEVSLYLFRDGILVNRGVMYGPWLPIYGTGCTLIILLTRFKIVRKALKNPFLTFFIIVLLCNVIEYFTSLVIEMKTGLRYWDYTGVFGNINGRICLECSIFFGLGGCLCVYIVAPFLERFIQKISPRVKITLCIALLTVFGSDAIYSNFYPNSGEGVTVNKTNTLYETDLEV